MKLEDIVANIEAFPRVPIYSVRCQRAVVSGTTLRMDSATKSLEWYPIHGFVIHVDRRGHHKVTPINNIDFIEELDPQKLLTSLPQAAPDPTTSTGHVVNQGGVQFPPPDATNGLPANRAPSSMRDMIFEAVKGGRLSFAEADVMLKSLDPIPSNPQVSVPQVQAPVESPRAPDGGKKKGRPPKSSYIAKDKIEVMAPNKVPLQDPDLQP
jgi:hypothetical protein